MLDTYENNQIYCNIIINTYDDIKICSGGYLYWGWNFLKADSSLQYIMVFLVLHPFLPVV